jgi:hypothetical protein
MGHWRGKKKKKKKAAEHTHGVRQCRMTKFVVLLRIFDVVVVDEAATVEFHLFA